MEILTGKKGYQDVDKVVESWSDMSEGSHREVQMEQLRLCAEIGIECTNFNPMKRPDAQNIINRLGEIKSLDGHIEIGLSTSQQSNPDVFTGTMRALWLSYQQLNPDIRRCIKYCTIFPIGSKLRMVELVGMWIALGFIKTSSASEDMEDVAEGYIQDLVSCSFLQPVGTSSGTDCFTINDELHDMLYKPGGNLFRIENNHSYLCWEEDVPRDVQHLLIQNYSGELITQKILGLENLLTLIVYDVASYSEIEQKDFDSICKRLTKLRVLAIPLTQIFMQHDEFSIPESIGQLKHLRYFACRTYRSCTLFLPKALNKLHHVQLLDFGDGKILEFNLGDLINLQKLFCSSDVKFVANISRMISLQTIPCVFRIRNAQGCEVKQLRDLNQLRGKLLIHGLENVTSMEEALQANLTSKKRLIGLELSWNNFDRCCSPEVEAEVLEGLCPPVGLEKLRICGYEGSRYPDWMVGKQNGGPKDLQDLELFSFRIDGPAPDLVLAFPHLHSLELMGCDWDALPGNMEHLTSLKKLKIESCYKIESLPALPQSIEQFHLAHCNDEFTKSCQTVGHPNWQKIEHIPHIYIDGISYPVATADPVATTRKLNRILSCINCFRCCRPNVMMTV